MIAFLGGLARAAVGAGWVSRSIVYPVAALACSWWAFGWSLWMIPFAVVPALTMWLGWTKWENDKYMAGRYGVPPLLLASVYGLTTGNPWPFAWAWACAAVGFVYWTLLKRFEKVDKTILGVHIDGARIAEFIAGTVIIGGVSLL